MNNDFKFDSQEVICNGITVGAVGTLNEDNRSTLEAFIKTHFMMSPPEVILKELEDSGMFTSDWIIGSRASSIDSIITRMVSGLFEYGMSKFQNKELTVMWINSQVKMMTARDIINILESALMDCASADHWYKYEKQWD